MPDNVFVNGRAAIHKGSAGKSVAFPDVCLCPPSPPSGPIPTPLPNTAQAMDLAGGAGTVTIEGNPMAHAKSYIARSTGNEIAQATGGGVLTHQVKGAAYFQTFSMNVFVESQPAVRHLDLLTHNHMAQMPGNTPPAPWMSMMDAGGGSAPGELEKRVGNKTDWIKIKVIDQEDRPVSAVLYRIKLPDGKKIEGRLLQGGTVNLQGLQRGACTVEFDALPVVPAQVKGKNQQATPYKDSPLSLTTGKSHLVQVAIPRVLCLDLPFDPADERYAKHRFILRSKDGAYEAKRTIADDALPGDRRLSLEFADLIPEKQYSLFHDDGEKTVGTFFVDRTYEELFPRRSNARPLQPKQALTEAPPAIIPTWTAEDVPALDEVILKDAASAGPDDGPDDPSTENP